MSNNKRCVGDLSSIFAVLPRGKVSSHSAAKVSGKTGAGRCRCGFTWSHLSLSLTSYVYIYTHVQYMYNMHVEKNFFPVMAPVALHLLRRHWPLAIARGHWNAFTSYRNACWQRRRCCCCWSPTVYTLFHPFFLFLSLPLSLSLWPSLLFFIIHRSSSPIFVH